VFLEGTRGAVGGQLRPWQPLTAAHSGQGGRRDGVMPPLQITWDMTIQIALLGPRQSAASYAYRGIQH
jgi:hypothetical protein